MVNYNNSKIYTIRCITDDTAIYVGATTQPLCKRFKNHQICLASIGNYILNKCDGDWSNWYIELYENFPCNSKEELSKREGEVIRAIGTINKRIECRTLQEYYIDNKEKILRRACEYAKLNVEKKKEYDKNYNIGNCDKIQNRNQKYRLEHKEELAEYEKRRNQSPTRKQKKREYYHRKKEENNNI